METIFDSDRINFVKVTEDLISEYLMMVNDVDNVARFIGRRTEPYTVEQEKDFVNSKLDSNAPIFSMIEKGSGDFIGNIELMGIEGDSAELGIAITANKQNVGYGKEAINRFLKYAFQILGVHRIMLKVYPDNERAIHVYNQCRFVEYARTEEDIFMEVLEIL